MKILGIIPARYNSSRFPGKPLIDIKGKTMIQRVYEGAKKSTKIDELIVATDDQRIVDEVLRFGGNVMLTNEHHATGTDRCGEVALKKPNFDVIINIQGDEPLINPLQLDQLLSAFEDQKVEIATLGINTNDIEELQNPNRIKIVKDKFDNALYFSRSFIPNANHFQSDALDFYPYLRHIGLYAFRKASLEKIIQYESSLLEQVESLEQLRWLYNGHKIKIIETSIETPNIDVLEDLTKVLNLIN